MHLEAATKEYVLAAVTGPVPDVTAYPVDMALVPSGRVLQAADWQAGTWLDGEAALLVDASGYAPGEYMLFARVTCAPEQPVLPSGRVRIGG